MIAEKLETQTGAIFISVIFGLGLAALFRQTCKGERCILVKSPDLEEINKHTYRYNQECYKYSPNMIPCPINK